MRLRAERTDKKAACFNPRTPSGVRRPGAFFSFFPSEVSIHAPRAGCDFRPIQSHSSRIVSIHAPRAGCDNTVKSIFMISKVSIHAPRAGCDRYYPWGILIRLGFNPRTPSGVRHTQGNIPPPWWCFNPRTPSGVRQYKKERAESQGNMWYVLRTYWYGFPLNKLSDFSFKLSS